jgi:2-polyprenyl-3-methyl-5-hydroxy-6-metoxy-1,4-benzoquinol methylase
MRGDYPYHEFKGGCAHEYLLPVLRQAIGRPSGAVLDLGCGNGWVTSSLISDGHDAYGVDSSHTGIALAAREHPGRFFTMDFQSQELPEALANKHFSTVISTEVIEHLYDPRKVLDLAHSLLLTDGRLIVSTPYHGYLKNLGLALAGKMDQHFTVQWDGGHIKFFSRATLERMLRDQGFKPLSFRGAGRIPLLWKSMVLTAAKCVR